MIIYNGLYSLLLQNTMQTLFFYYYYIWNLRRRSLCCSERIVSHCTVRRNYYYLSILEVVIYDYYATADINFMDFEFEKYGNWNVFRWKHIIVKVQWYAPDHKQQFKLNVFNIGIIISYSHNNTCEQRT